MGEQFALGITDLTLGAIFAISLLAVIMSLLAVAFAQQRARLPAATQYTDINERLAIAQTQYADKQKELRELDRQMTQRDRVAAEIVALEDVLKRHQSEHEALDDARREIEKTRREAADAAGQYADAKQALDRVRDAHDQKSAELRSAEQALERLEREEAEAEDALDRLQQEKAAIEEALRPLRDERDVATRAIMEAEQVKVQLAEWQRRISTQREEKDRLEAALEPLRLESDKLRSEVEAYRADSAILSRAKSEAEEAVAGLNARKAWLDEKIGELKAEVERHRTDLGNLEGGAIGSRLPDTAILLGELLRQPDCLASPATLRRAPRGETTALNEVKTYLKEHGLAYSDRVVRGFHTALKINDKAQIAVLAGVSGTGKSLLPRRYAEAMGIHFLQIAVEPRWDSPQDMLGFYNYIEQKFRATDLARLLAHMDPNDTPQIGNLLDPAVAEHRFDHMALVLLDEMNLARVEYYFSEFLSRLEARPPYGADSELRSRKDAEIPIDIRGLGRELRLYPAHNILFAGTMNDDETTQALSPKVLDRGNVMQFAAPESFANSGASKATLPVQEAQSFKGWRTWVRDGNGLDRGAKETGEKFIGRLANVMERFGRPIGFRTRDAILAYCANYPALEAGQADIRVPLADQVEYRVMPRLRGIDIEGATEGLESLVGLVRDDLADETFALKLEGNIDEQRRGAGLFNWRGLTRLE